MRRLEKEQRKEGPRRFVRIDIPTAKQKINAAQVSLIEELEAIVGLNQK